MASPKEGRGGRGAEGGMKGSYQPPARRDGEDEPPVGLQETMVQHQEDQRDAQEDQHDTHRPLGVPGNEKNSGQIRSGLVAACNSSTLGESHVT